jgi:hypothetical protein
MSEEKFLPQAKVTSELHAWLQAKATAEKRSVTQQLIWELEKNCKADKEKA